MIHSVHNGAHFKRQSLWYNKLYDILYSLVRIATIVCIYIFDYADTSIVYQQCAYVYFITTTFTLQDALVRLMWRNLILVHSGELIEIMKEATNRNNKAKLVMTASFPNNLINEPTGLDMSVTQILRQSVTCDTPPPILYTGW